MKIMRNDYCPCGSGKKHEHCCIDASFSEQNIITLDTCVCRNLMRENESPWYNDFCAMHEHGIHFCIADVCCVELLNQFLKGAISPDAWRLMIDKLKSFISPNFPILPGKKQLFQLIGTKYKQPPSVPNDFDASFEMAYSMALFNMMEHIDDGADSVSFVYGGQKYRLTISDLASKCHLALQQERNDWKTHIKDISKNFTEPCGSVIIEIKRYLDDSFENEIPLSHRMDLLIKYLVKRLYLASMQRHAYDPCSDRNENDGIDFVALFPIILPSRFCTNDRIKNIIRHYDFQCFQKNWLVSPNEIVDLYNNGQLLHLQWDYSPA